MKNVINSIERAAAESDFSGAVSIHVEGKTVFERAYGRRDRSNDLPNTVDTRFGIASGTKLLTALGIGALVDADKLTVTTEVGELRADFHTFIDPAATVEHLLTHTSGVYDYYDEDVITDFDNFYVDIPWYRLATPSDYLPLFAGQAMKFSPGERFSYSNGGYILLGILIEGLSGQLYRDFIQEHVLAPAAIVDSGFFAFNDLPENVAFGYLGEGTRTNIYNLPMRGASDGGMYTTLHDLKNLWTALFAREIVSASFTDALLEPHVTFDDEDGDDGEIDEEDAEDVEDEYADEEQYDAGDESTEGGYGYGVYWSVTGRGNKMYYIVGGDAGVGFDSAYFPQQKTAITILSNETNGEEEMRSAIYDTLEL